MGHEKRSLAIETPERGPGNCGPGWQIDRQKYIHSGEVKNNEAKNQGLFRKSRHLMTIKC